MEYSVKLIEPLGEWCVFRVRGAEAQQVKLVIDYPPGACHIFSLHPTATPGEWETSLRLPEGDYRFCYHLYDGRSLTYLTPPHRKMEGIKAVLHVRPGRRMVDDVAAPKAKPEMEKQPALAGTAIERMPELAYRLLGVRA